MEKILIAGGSGFIGQHLLEFFRSKRNYRLTIFDLVKPQFAENPGEFIKGDITKYEQVDKALKNHDLVIDLAGLLGTDETFDEVSQVVNVNVVGAVNVFEAAKKYKRKVIYVSLTNDWLNPYTITKQTANRFAQMYYDQFGTKISVLKALNVYGEYQKFHGVKKIGPQFIVNALLGKPLVIFGDGSQKVDLVDAREVCRAINLAISNNRAYGKQIDVGTGKPISVIEVAKLIIKLTGSKSKIIKAPIRRGEPKNSLTVANTSLAKKLLKFEHRTQLSEGLRRTINWYRAQLNNLKKYSLLH